MLTKIGNFPVMQAPLLVEEHWLRHGFGFQNIAIEQYCDFLGCDDLKIPKIKQAHTDILSIDGEEITADAMMTDRPGLLLHVRTGDCLPILMADPEHRAIAAVHAGWRGTAARLVEKTLHAMHEHYGTDFSKVKVALGPAIGGRNYPVGIDVVKELENTGLCPGPWCTGASRGKWSLDIAFANRFLLQKRGVTGDRIFLSLSCTFCDNRLASFRRDGAARGEQANFILIRNS